MDNLAPDQRSRNMARIGRKDTKPEVRVRRAAHALGLRFRVHRRDLPGTPDIVFPRRRTVILVHGCFWHSHGGCRRSRLPSSNVEFWQLKIARNHERDLAVAAALMAAQWRVEVIWECETKTESEIQARLRTIFAETRD